MNKANKLLIIYLNKSACIDYVTALLHQIKEYKPIIWSRTQNSSRFNAHLGLVSLNPFSLISKLRKLREGTNTKSPNYLIWLPAFHPLNLLICMYAKHQSNIKTILTVHDYTFHSGEKNFVLEMIQKFTINFADKIVFLSSHERTKSTNKKTLKNSIVLPHPVPQVHSTHQLGFTTKPSILFFGRIQKYKGLDLLIKSIDYSKIDTLTIAGQGNLTTNIGDNPKLKIMNYHISDKQREYLFLNHHLLILPYTEASQSGVLSMSIAYQIPALISNVGGLQEQISAKATIKFQPDEEGIGEAIDKYIAFPKWYSETKQILPDEKQRINDTFKNKVKALTDDLFNLFQ